MVGSKLPSKEKKEGNVTASLYGGSLTVGAPAVPIAGSGGLAKAVAPLSGTGGSDAPNDCQIVNRGGSKTDGSGEVSVSKTIAGTEYENVFDITLAVRVTESVMSVSQDPDIAVVIVMDISNSMLEDFNGTKLSERNVNKGNYEACIAGTKYEAAMNAAGVFIDQFAEYAIGDQSKLGFVAFNTDGNEIASMQSCDTVEKATVFKDTVRTKTGNIVKKYDGMANYTTSYHTDKRYTNIEAGLKMANDMLVACTNENKFVIFLSDGLPTTYCKTANQMDKNYIGYTPVSGSGKVNDLGVFYDAIKGAYISSGTNYSDTAAIRARQMATKMKADGIMIYTIGAGLNIFSGTVLTGKGKDNNLYPDWDENREVKNLSGERFIQNQMARAFHSGSHTIDNRLVTSKLNSYNAATINGYHWEIGNFAVDENGEHSEGSYARLGTGGLFENWLRYGIGSGEYYDTADAAALRDALDDIFSELSEYIERRKADVFAVTDPMGPNIELIGFYDKSGGSGSLKDGLEGSSVLGGENTAKRAGSGFVWYLRKSGWTKSGSEGNYVYEYVLTYRVRLTNEARNGFDAGAGYDTNGETTLTWETVENGKASDLKSIRFDVPKVKGYLAGDGDGGLTFRKVDERRPNAGLEGAEFRLEHDTENCARCRDGLTDENVVIAGAVAVSGEGGTVSFPGIPSGHVYRLRETKAPDGYEESGAEYRVKVAYGETTVTPLSGGDWNGTVTNRKIGEEPPEADGDGFMLPDTGGIGTAYHAAGGTALAAVSALCLSYRRRRGIGR